MDNYTGRFGDALRRLTGVAPRVSGAAVAPQQMGGADAAAAGSGFSVQAPQATDAPGMGTPQPLSAMGGVAPAQAEAVAQAPTELGGFGGDAPQQPSTGISEAGAAGDPGEGGMSWSKLVKMMTPKAKKQIADKIEAHTPDLKTAYEKAATQNGDTPKPKASREHMALYLGEIALRYAANRGSSENSGEALAKATLQTDSRRQGIRDTEADRARQDAETRRLEGRADDKDAKVYNRTRSDAAADHTRDRAEKDKDDLRDHEQALELERLRAARDRLARKGTNSRLVVDKAGDYQLIDDEGQVITPTQEVEETTPAKGSRGAGTTPAKTTTKKVPIKAQPKVSAADTLDPDTVVRNTAAAVKEIKADRKTMQALRKQFGGDVTALEEAVTKMARERVEGDVQSLGGGTGGKTTKFSDLP